MTALLKLLAAGIARLPFFAAMSVGRGFGHFFGRVVRHRRRDALDAISRAFPQLSAAEVRRLANVMYAHLGTCGAEFLWLTPARMPEFMAHRLAWDGREHFDRVLGAGRGALVLTAHAGNWELFCRITAAAGYGVTVVVKPFRDAAVTDHVNAMRKAYGYEVLPRDGSSRGILRALKANRLVGFVLDQNMTRDEGVFVEFFGRPACTSAGLAHIAALTQVPVIPAFMERLPHGRHIVHVSPPLAPPPDREPETLRAATRNYTRIIETYIRAHPEQWTWIHRRWRTKPLPASD